MKIGILGLGVIGTTYAYAFQKAGHETYHIVREQKRGSVPNKISVHLLDGRYNSKGEEKDDEGKRHDLDLPLFYGNMDRVLAKIEG